MKRIQDFRLIENIRFNDNYSLLRLKTADGSSLPEILPGQFVQVAIETPGVFLRRPISINNVESADTLSLLVRRAGNGTEWLVGLETGHIINLLLPLGNGFSTSVSPDERVLLVGGGVGVAPLLYLGKYLKSKGICPEYLVGARSRSDLLQIEMLEGIGNVHACTEDGTQGVNGFVTAHPVLNEKVNRIFCCGPAPMMKAVAAIARERGIDCEVSLENMMACGLGACLCCVEKTVKGNVCVCTEGPVFNINQLTW